jgi:hypothetical protein
MTNNYYLYRHLRPCGEVESLNISSKQLANKLRGRIEKDTKMIKLC